MIATKRILAEMERQLHQARTTNDEQAIREALAAIRSLCEVVLGEETIASQPVVQQAVPLAQQPKIHSLESKPLVEEDANGGSIFDF